MKAIIVALASVALLTGPAFAARHSTNAKERAITRQLNLEQAQQAQMSNQASSQQVATASIPAQSPPAAAPTTPVESAPAVSPNADQSADPQPTSPAQ